MLCEWENLQKRGTKYILFIIILIITWMMSTTLGTRGPLNGGGPLHGAWQRRRRCGVLHVVEQAELVEALRWMSALRRFVGRALWLRAVRVAQRSRGGRLMALNPRIVIAHNIFVIQTREQRHFAFNPSELLTGRVNLDTLHSIVTAVKFILNLKMIKRKPTKMFLPMWFKFTVGKKGGAHLYYSTKGSLSQKLQFFKLIKVARKLPLQPRTERSIKDVASRDNWWRKVHSKIWVVKNKLTSLNVSLFMRNTEKCTGFTNLWAALYLSTKNICNINVVWLKTDKRPGDN